MCEACKETRGWFSNVSVEVSAKLVAKASSSCTPSEIADLLMQGADPCSAVDVIGRTPLHWAVQMDNVVVASLLMDFGAPAEAPDTTRTLPLHVAASVGFSGVLAALLIERSSSAGFATQNCSGWTALHIGAFMGNSVVVRLLLAQKGIDVNIGDAEGASPLHAAAGAGQLEPVRLLISRGALVNARATSGDTPLHYAARMGHAAIVIALLKAGADRTQKNGDGIACLGMARFGDWAAVADKDLAACLPNDLDLPVMLEIGASVPEARSHHFIVEEKAVEAVAGTWVTFPLRTSPPRLGMRFVVDCKSSFGANVTYGWTTDHQNGSYSISYRQPTDEKAEVTVGLVEGGQVVAKRGFMVNTVEPRVVGRFCVGFGTGLYDPQPGANKFSIRARNQCGTNMDKGGNQESFKVKLQSSGDKITFGEVKDVGGGLYAVSCQLPDKGGVELDVTFQGQSISGFPVSFNMDLQAKLIAFFGMRKVEEDIRFLQKKLGKKKNFANLF
jgi:ankyrin repeat protein